MAEDADPMLSYQCGNGHQGAGSSCVFLPRLSLPGLPSRVSGSPHPPEHHGDSAIAPAGPSGQPGSAVPAVVPRGVA